MVKHPYQRRTVRAVYGKATDITAAFCREAVDITAAHILCSAFINLRGKPFPVKCNFYGMKGKCPAAS
jgi:hypothetical protein